MTPPAAETTVQCISSHCPNPVPATTVRHEPVAPGILGIPARLICAACGCDLWTVQPHALVD